jgi:DNA replication initiation complex subunit (GINS family)
MKTPVRPVRIDDDLWKAAQRVAEDLQHETGLSATASDVVRKALTEYVERWKASKRAAKAAS